MNFTPDEKEAYEDHLKWLRIEANTLKKYEQKGKEEGANETKIQIARNLLKAGLADNLIAEATNLSVEEILKLKG